MIDDIIISIGRLLSDHDKIYLSMVSKKMDKFKYKFMYYDEIRIKQIINLPYFDNFENVTIENTADLCPRFVKFVHYATEKTDIPNGVTHLKFNDTFDCQLHSCIPLSVTHLVFGWNFNQPIKKNNIPSLVTHLTFGDNFNQPIKKCIPSLVTHLTFGYDFNQTIKDNIPASVTHLRFGGEFNKSIKENIPPSVKHLVLGSYFNKSIKNNIPTSVTYLEFGPLFNRLDEQIPSSVTHLTISMAMQTWLIRPTVTHLELARGNNDARFPIPFRQNIPKSITHLIFRDWHRYENIKEYIPDSVTHLTFSCRFKMLLDDIISSSITQITLPRNYDLPLSKDILSRVEILRK